jgi:multidrug resistance efflux pump
MADAGHVRFARELEARDERLAAALAHVRALQADVDELRAHAAAAIAFRAAYPAEQARLAGGHAAAADELQEREAALAAAEAELARAKEGEDRAAARRAVTRTGDAAASARRKLARLAEERASLDRESVRVEADALRLEQRRAELGTRLAGTPRATAVPTPDPGLEALVGWTSRARAALFVTAGGLENEREHVVREAAELGAAVLGEATAATSVRLVRERVEQATGA